jgi:hypothetical protein
MKARSTDSSLASWRRMVSIWESGASSSPVNAWTHIALTYDGNILRLYVNGVEVGTKAISGALQQTSNQMSNGGNLSAEYFQGLIDEARVYNRALSPAEIQTIMGTPLS